MTILGRLKLYRHLATYLPNLSLWRILTMALSPEQLAQLQSDLDEVKKTSGDDAIADADLATATQDMNSATLVKQGTAAAVMTADAKLLADVEAFLAPPAPTT